MGKTIGIIGLFLAIIIFSVWYIFHLNQPSNDGIPFPTETPTQLETVKETGGISLSPVDVTDPEPTPTVTPTPKATKERLVTVIDTQAVVLYTPQTVTETTPLIVYSHGSNEEITKDGPAPAFFDEAITTYGTYFAEHGNIFVASNMYGQNWGSAQSVDHLYTVIKSLQQEYNLSSETYLYGFSMGGLPTLRFAKKYPAEVTAIALLAPTIAMDDWTESAIQTISDIPITIWHGTKDVNVLPTVTKQFYDRAMQYGDNNITYTTVPNEIHRHFLTPKQIADWFESAH